MTISQESAPPSSSDLLAVRFTSAAALGGFLLGYSSASISGALSAIEATLIDPLGLGETARNTLAGFIVSSTLVGCVSGALAAGWLSKRFGRKAGMLVAAVLFLLSTIGSAVPELGINAIGTWDQAAITALICYRLLCGIAIGIVSMLAPLCVAEISAPERRGRLITVYQLAAVSGFVAVYFTNWLIASLGDDAWLHAIGWRLMLASAALPAMIFLMLLRTVPDTPHGYVARGRKEEALALLRRLFTEHEAQRTFDEICRSSGHQNQPLFAVGARVVIIGILLAMFQQLMGINAVLYYSPLMFANLGASTDTALLLTVVIAAINMGFTFVAMFTVDTWGRKPLLILGALIMAAAMIALGASFASGTVRLAAVVSVSIYLAAFTFSWGPVSAILISEMFPNSIKSKALALAVAMQWLANILVSWTFRILDGNSTLNAALNHGFAYFMYGMMCLLAAFFVLRWVPETKGMRLEAIESLWK